MDILKMRTLDLYNEIQGRIQKGELSTIDDVAEAIVKGADSRCVVFGEMKEAATFQMMGDIDSESLYELVESK